ncbi:MAG: sulfurtransferase TusA family protein [Halieaceae bacterium]|nr:sulfurtransferase TusA family protein [Halieaceae bacterium]MCP5203960.1 sulfurtransferase TusA family protein [Pseudomonadales bacterium]
MLFWSLPVEESSFCPGEWIYCAAPEPRCDEVTDSALVELDARGLECPMPLLQAKRALNGMRPGQRLQVLATDQGSVRDFRVFAQQSGHLLLASEEADGVYRYLLQKS